MNWGMVLIEFVLVLAALAMILVRPPRSSSGFLSLQSRFSRLARRKSLCVVAIGLLTIALRLAFNPLLRIPAPADHDEYGYLLAADTFAHGRLANPPHPMWVHFESFHILQQPLYVSIYPPGQGLILALGEILGHPWIGVLLITGTMCSAFCWMLQGWLPLRWALFGSILAMLRLGLLSYWMNSYWGGSLAALAGALVLGALPRLKRHARARDALLMAAGLAVLANTRPYEGLLLSLPVAFSLLIWMFRSRGAQAGALLKRVVIPLAVVLAFAGLATGYYYHRVTGSAFRTTYQVDRAQYGSVPFFLFQHPRVEPAYRHAVLKKFYDHELHDYQQARTLAGFLASTGFRLFILWAFFLGPILTVPLIALPWALRDRRIRFPLITLSLSVLGLMLVSWMLPHYLAPGSCLIYLILTQGLRHLATWRRRNRAYGLAIVQMVMLLCCAMIALRLMAIPLHAQIEPAWPRGSQDRVHIQRTLEDIPGEHLILVRYRDTHNVHSEWVYNAADIDAARIVWARDMGDAGNQELLHYFADRKVWLLEADDTPPRIEPYPQASAKP